MTRRVDQLSDEEIEELRECLEVLLKADSFVEEGEDPEEYDDGSAMGEQDWFSLTLGYLLAKGKDFPVAHELSLILRYQLHYELENLPAKQ